MNWAGPSDWPRAVWMDGSKAAMTAGLRADPRADWTDEKTVDRTVPHLEDSQAEKWAESSADWLALTQAG